MPPNEALQRQAGDALAVLPPHERDLFALRLDRWYDDLLDGLAAVYPSEQVGPLVERVVLVAAVAYAARAPELKRLDLQRSLEPDWFQHPRMLGYAAYADRFAGDLAGVREHIPYLEELGVTYLHLMPLLRPREVPNDGGYAVADYRSVRPDLGDVGDLRELATALRDAGISLCLDLVLNHVAREHPWAVAARAGDERHRAYFRLFADRGGPEGPDAYEQTLPEVFPDFAPGSFTWDDEIRAWVWTTFNSWQWDVDWSNPDVFCEYADIVCFLANAGVEVLRLDAIACLWKRLGTSCQNQPEVHSLVQALRAVVRLACPAVVFTAEAIVGPSDLIAYLGRGAHHGKVSDLAYHNSLMVQIWSMLASRDVRLTAIALGRFPARPASTAWITYVRCHDDIGWAVDDADAAAAGISGWDHRAFLSDYYSGNYPGSHARGLVFQENPVTKDRRISGTAASLAGLDDALESGDAERLDLAVARLLLAHAVVVGWGGVPVIWMGDELALRNDAHWADEPAHADDNRWVHRPRMPWADAARRSDPATVEGRVWSGLRHLARARASLPHLHASVRSEVAAVHDAGVLPVLRRHPVGPFLALYNVTESWRPYPWDALRSSGVERPVDRVGGHVVTPGGDGNVWLPPYAAWWLTDG